MEKTKNNLRQILEINKKINSYSNLRDILENILFSARELFNSVGGSLLLVDDTGKYLNFEVVHGDGKEKLEGLKIPINRGIAGYIFSNMIPVISNNTEKDPRFFSQVDKITGLKTQKILGVPLVKDNKAIGVIEIVNKADNTDFSKEDLELLQIFAEQAVIAINNATLIKKIQDRAREFEYLYEVSNLTISSIQNSKELFDNITSLVSNIANAKRVSIMMFDDKIKALKIYSSIGIEEKITQNVCVRVEEDFRPSVVAFKEGKHIIVYDVDKDKRFRPNKKLRYRSNSFMVFPIKTHSNTIGVLNITESDVIKNFDKEEIELLQLIANQIGYTYESIKMYEREIEKKALDREIEVMTKIQMDMLPQKFELTPRLDIHFFVQPYKMVGGDFYDVFMLSDDELCFFLGDVSGKGLPASLFMAAVKSTIKAISFEFREPEKILEVTNSILLQSSESSMFSTLFLGMIDLKNNTLKFSNAGHGQQFILRHSDVDRLYTKGIPLGIFSKKYSQKVIPLMSGDVIVVYSDGITECVNENEEMFGEKRLIDIIRQYKNLPSREITDKVMESIRVFKVDNPNYDDDISLGIIKVV